MRTFFSLKLKGAKNAASALDIIRTSPFFDADWYRKSHNDLSDTRIDAARHYIEHGASEGRDPGPKFDTKFYLEQYPDVKEAGINPLLHYILHGAAEGRLPKPAPEMPSTPQPGAQVPDLPTPPLRPAPTLTPKPEKRPPLKEPARAKTKNHETNARVDLDSAEKKIISQYFDRDFYLHRYPDIYEAQIDPLEHFYSTGWKEYRDPTPWFSTSYYMESNEDIRNSGMNPFWHYLVHGRSEGRSPKATLDARQDFLKYLQAPIDLGLPPDLPEEELVSLETLTEKLRNAFAEANGVVLSFSHTCYLQVTAGTELFIADEQKSFNERKFAYLHFAPLEFSIFINSEPVEKTFTRMSLDGEVIGVAAFSDVVSALKRVAVTKLRRRLLVMHSPLGQSAAAFVRVFSTLEPTDTFYWVHDYSSLCTGYNLLRNHVAFCHAPALDSVGCSVCVFEASRMENARYLQQMFRTANFTVVAPSESALNIWRNSSNLPHKAVMVQEHCRLTYSDDRPRKRRKAESRGSAGDPVRVAFVGFPVHHKGWPAFERLVEETWIDPAYRFYHFSKTSGTVHTSRIRHVDVSVSPDRRDAMVDLLGEHEIDIVTILAPWPETFSYVTFEALAAGCDIVTLADSGNVAAVVGQTGRGRIFSNEDEILDFFLRHEAVDFVRSRLEAPNPRGTLVHCGTSAAIVFAKAN